MRVEKKGGPMFVDPLKPEERTDLINEISNGYIAYPMQVFKVMITEKSLG